MGGNPNVRHPLPYLQSGTLLTRLNQCLSIWFAKVCNNSSLDYTFLKQTDNFAFPCSGGPAGIVYGYIVIFAGTLSVFATLSELVSMAPTSGGQYHWVSILAPSTYRTMSGYIIGWMELTGWQALVASGGYVTGTMIQGAVLLCNPSYINHKANWHGTLLFWGVILFAYLINTALGSLLSKFGGILLIIHILGFFAVLLPLIILGEHSDAGSVFDSWLNLGHWPTLSLSMCIGMQGHVFAFLGADAAMHVSLLSYDI